MGKITDKFAALKNKFPKGSVFGKKPEVRPGEEGLAALGDFAKMTAKEAGREEYGRGGEKQSIFSKIKGGFSKAKGKYSEWSKKRSEAARKKNYFTVRKCPKCGQMHTGAEPCPATGKPEPGVSSATEGIEKEPRKINPGAKILMPLSVLGIAFSYVISLPSIFIIICAAILALCIITIFLPKWVGTLLLVGGLVCVALLFALSGFDPIKRFIPPSVSAQLQEVGEQSKETYDNAMDVVNEQIERAKCFQYLSSPPQYDACIKKIEDEKKEEIANPWKTYETLEVKRGNPYQNYDYIKPEEGEDYDLELTFINKNEQTYEINLTKIDVKFGDESAEDGITEYVLEPNEEKYMRYFFPSTSMVCDSKSFKVNVTSRQTGGGTSEFAMAPNEEEEEWRKELRSFKPNPIADPGPLNIYAFTYPTGIAQSDFVGKNFQIIIKIKNPKVKGIAHLDDLYLIQKFKFPHKYFTILSCTGVTTDPATDKCQDNPNSNCLKLTFDSTLDLPMGKTIEIKCDVDIDENEPLDDVYKDLIRVEATYDFTQEWTFSSGCTASTTITPTTIATTTHEIPPHI